MKSNLVLPVIFSLITFNCSSQIAVQKQQNQKAVSSKPVTAQINQALKQDTLVQASSKTSTTPIKEPVINPGALPYMKKGIVLPPKKNTTPSSTNTNATRNNASLLEIFGKVSTGMANVGNGWGCNKDPDTHWSFGLFDQNDNPIASFHDDSNTDEYAPASSVTVKMHIDRQAKFSDFVKDGHIHVNIAPNGNDSWCFDQLTLTIDFVNPDFTLTVNLAPGVLSQDHRDVDLHFYYDGQNFVVR